MLKRDKGGGQGPCAAVASSHRRRSAKGSGGEVRDVEGASAFLTESSKGEGLLQTPLDSEEAACAESCGCVKLDGGIGTDDI